MFTRSPDTTGGTDNKGFSSVAQKPPKWRLETGGLAYRLNDIIDSATNWTIPRHAGTSGGRFEFNNILYRQINANNVKLDDMLRTLAKREEYYYSMFARMESALMQSNSQMQYLLSMMGQQF